MIENSNTQLISTECPRCMCKMRFHQPLQLGQTVICPECKKQLQVYQLHPLELDYAFDRSDNDDDYNEYNHYR